MYGGENLQGVYSIGKEQLEGRDIVRRNKVRRKGHKGKDGLC